MSQSSDDSTSRPEPATGAIDDFAAAASRHALSGLVSVEYVEHISQMTRTELDELPFGAIQLDRNGVIRRYNAFEASLSGMRPGDVLGRNFFTEVAPCTNIRAFAGRYRDGVIAGNLHVVFPYEFTFPDRRMRVTVTLIWRAGGGWVFVSGNRK